MIKETAFLLFSFLITVSTVQAATHFVAKSGVDSALCGSANSPCMTIEYAVESRAKSGDLVSINDGSYIENSISVPAGVSISSTSKDKTKVTILPKIEMNTGSPLLSLVGTSLNSIGQQEISYITLDGRQGVFKAHLGIEVRNRNDVSIHHCTITNFYLDNWVSWPGTYALKVWSSEVQPTSSWEYYSSLINKDLSKTAIYPKNPVKNFHFFENRVTKSGTGSVNGDRLFSPAIYTWHLYGSSFHDNFIDVSHAQTEAITGTSALLEKVDIYNNVIIGHKIGGFPKSTTPSHSMYLIELWVLHDCRFYNNKLIRGVFSTTFGKNVEWYNNYIDTSSATQPAGFFIEATFINNASIHHNKMVCNPEFPAENMGFVVGSEQQKGYEIEAYIWGNILHDVRGHVISLDSTPIDKVKVHIYNNLVDHGVLWRGINLEEPEYVSIKNNIITNTPDGIYVYEKRAAPIIDTNIFFGNTRNFYECSGSNNLLERPTYVNYALDDFAVLNTDSPQANSGVALDQRYKMGLSAKTYWGTATSEDLPRVVLADHTMQGAGWEIGPYVLEEDAVTCTPSWSCSDSSCSICQDNKMTCTEICVDSKSCLSETRKQVTRDCVSASDLTIVNVYTSIPIVIDGSSQDAAWAQSIPVALNKNTMNGYWPGTATIPEINDASFNVRSLWDTTYLYLFFEVKDDVLKTDSSTADLWKDDSVELYLEGEKNAVSEYQQADNKLIISADGRVLDVRTKGWDKTMSIGKSAVTGGYNLEIRIPWATIGVIPENLYEIGIAFQLNDDDGGNPDISLFWKNEGSPNIDTNAFQTMVLDQKPGCIHQADADCSGMIDLSEVVNFLQRWRNEEVSMTDVVLVITLWRG